jgi:hypothetical protein
MTTADIRSQYEEKLWRALDSAVRYTDLGLKSLAAGESIRLGRLLDDIALKGWAVRLVTGPNGTAAMHFYPPQPDDRNDRNELPLTAMTDRELLVKFSDMFYSYDRRRDDELAFLDKHPNREAWDDSEREAYKEIVDDVQEKYAELAKLLDYVDRTRRDPFGTLSDVLRRTGPQGEEK